MLINESNKKLNYLIVVAHPDDEVLGAGATIKKLTDNGFRVAVAIMSTDVSIRSNKSENLMSEIEQVRIKLGVEKYYFRNFPNLKMNTVPHIDLVQFIENCILDFDADAIITHSPSETNDDHIQTSKATQAASRLFQRKAGVRRLKLFMYMEVPSSTDWSFDYSNGNFHPNFFVEVGENRIIDKINILKLYKGVTREYPHPRSDKSITGLASYRGSCSGCNMAEAFVCVFSSN